MMNATKELKRMRSKVRWLAAASAAVDTMQSVLPDGADVHAKDDAPRYLIVTLPRGTWAEAMVWTAKHQRAGWRVLWREMSHCTLSGEMFGVRVDLAGVSGAPVDPEQYPAHVRPCYSEEWGWQPERDFTGARPELREVAS